ncbi:2OG-Fe(II) oxygenase superfamily protein [Rhodobiaceae bacterium]|nr:2OG-Fe(II) oxygenase superfamily protein [Rhodobiaceae bacterium]
MECLPPGATLINDFVSVGREQELLSVIDNAPWLQDLRRRVQHYGWRYDYKARRVSEDAWLGPLPNWLQQEIGRFSGSGLFDETPDQVIVNEYEPGQGIAPHVDCVPCFGPIIASLSLGGRVEMRFENTATGKKRETLLPARSLLVLTGPARYEWRHNIPARKSDVIDGRRVGRKRRISLTFRRVISDLT